MWSRFPFWIVQLFFLLTFLQWFCWWKAPVLCLALGCWPWWNDRISCLSCHRKYRFRYRLHEKQSLFLQFIPEADRTFGGEFRSITYQIGETWNKRFLSVEITSDGSDSSKTSSTPGWHRKLYVFLHLHIKYKGIQAHSWTPSCPIQSSTGPKSRW